VKIPPTPPLLSTVIAKLEPKEFSRLAGLGIGPLVNGQYLHWDELRHRTPPEGLAHDAW
jgi:hypothetical protein